VDFRKHYAAIHLATQFGQDLARSPDAEVIRDAVGIVTLCANTTAGHNFACDRSENGNRTKTTATAAGMTMLRPPPAGSSHQQVLAHLAALFLKH